MLSACAEVLEAEVALAREGAGGVSARRLTRVTRGWLCSCQVSFPAPLTHLRFSWDWTDLGVAVVRVQGVGALVDVGAGSARTRGSWSVRVH